MLVLGAADDGLVTNAEVRATARAYRTEAELFADMGHNMMQEPGWTGVAERIDAWLPAAPSSASAVAAVGPIP